MCLLKCSSNLGLYRKLDCSVLQLHGLCIPVRVSSYELGKKSLVDLSEEGQYSDNKNIAELTTFICRSIIKKSRNIPLSHIGILINLVTFHKVCHQVTKCQHYRKNVLNQDVKYPYVVDLNGNLDS